VILLALTAIASLAVDFGRVQVVKTQLRAAADAAALAAAHDMTVNGTSSARNTAVFYAKANNADGTPVILDRTNDIEFGWWDTATRKFTVRNTSDTTQLNAVHVLTHRIAARKTAVPLTFASIIGQANCDVNAESIVMVTAALDVNQNVPATANPFLAGMPAGSEASNINPHHNPDYAGTASTPKESPLAVAMPVSGGQTLNFDSIDGTARHDPNDPYYNPDGNPNDYGHNILNTDPSSASYRNTSTLNAYSQNGIADVTAPINALVGVFLDDSQPNLSSTPQGLDFSTDASRDFDTIGGTESGGTVQNQSLKLKQIFFIGDGMNSKGVKQSFIAPKGATRLFLATWDFYEWNNNAGFRNIKVTRPEKLVLVR